MRALIAIVDTDAPAGTRSHRSLRTIHGHSSPLNTGSIGNGLSHQRLLDSNRDAAFHLHVLEDDAEILPELPKWFAALAEHHSWDLFYSDVYFSMLSPQVFQQLSRPKEVS